MGAVDDGTEPWLQSKLSEERLDKNSPPFVTNVVEDLRDWLGDPQDCLAM
jgi:hypothetical protein